MRRSMAHARAAAIVATAVLLGCTSAAGPDTAEPRPSVAGSSSLLESSIPANGSTLSRSPENMVFMFSRPVRLSEVTITSRGGTTIPTMVTAAGDLKRFSIPLPPLEPDVYTVRWRALDRAAQPHEGSIGFTIR